MISFIIVLVMQGIGGIFAATINIVLLAIGGDDVSAAFYCFLLSVIFLTGLAPFLDILEIKSKLDIAAFIGSWGYFSFFLRLVSIANTEKKMLSKGRPSP